MTDYNDGNWHAWDGGECPVHPDSLVEVLYVSRDLQEGYAGGRYWRNPLLFRVTKEHREPREFWITGAHWFASKAKAEDWNNIYSRPKREIIHVVEKPE